MLTHAIADVIRELWATKPVSYCIDSAHEKLQIGLIHRLNRILDPEGQRLIAINAAIAKHPSLALALVRVGYNLDDPTYISPDYVTDMAIDAIKAGDIILTELFCTFVARLDEVVPFIASRDIALLLTSIIGQSSIEGYIDSVDAQTGMSALHKAVLNSDLELVRLLVETCFATVDVQDAQGRTALHLALTEADKKSTSYKAIITFLAPYSSQPFRTTMASL